MTRRLALVLGAIAAASSAAGVAACVGNAPTDCASYGTCPLPDADGATDATTDVGDGSLSEMNEGGDAVAPADAASEDGASDASSEVMTDAAPEADGDAAALDAGDGFDGFVCDPMLSPRENPCVLSADLGVFVAPDGFDTNPGTPQQPVRTLAAGAALASTRGLARVYVCQGTYSEAVTLTGDTSIYGGLACPQGDAGWSFGDGGVSLVMAPANHVPLRIDTAPGALTIEDMGWMASAASGQDDAGNGLSSIAAFVNEATVTFQRCTFTAGNGAPGAPGSTDSNYSGAQAPSGQPPADGGEGGAGGSIVCADGTNSRGGTGGNGAAPSGGSGGDGGAQPLPPPQPQQDGVGGSGGMFSCATVARPGANGTAGDAGGVAATSTNYGTLTASGWTPSAGGAAPNGAPGQGGGGAGGSGMPLLGGSGGGAGGCGGAGGQGGSGGGASIGLASTASNVTLQACTISTGLGGAGGPGGAGQSGQAGGVYGAAIGPCLGGYGGNGAGGGGGAGGTAGISVCLVYRGSPPTGTPVCARGGAGLAGPGGPGGAGGSNVIGSGPPGPDGGLGASGVSTTVLSSP